MWKNPDIMENIQVDYLRYDDRKERTAPVLKNPCEDQIAYQGSSIIESSGPEDEGDDDEESWVNGEEEMVVVDSE